MRASLCAAALLALACCQPEASAPAVTSEELAAGINGFGTDLFGAVLAEGEPSDSGVVISPFSVAQALSMLLNGADPTGQSFAQLQSVVFGTPAGGALPLPGVNTAMKALADELLDVPADGNLTIDNANSAWLKATYELQQAFSQALDQYYSAEVELLSTAEVVNEWVSNATRGKIDEIVNQDIVDQATLLLINALYFKGLWEVPFDKADTAPMDFRLLTGATMSTAMMRQMYDNYADKAAAQVARYTALPVNSTTSDEAVPCVSVKLAYQGDKYSAILAMPEGNLSSGAGPLRLASPDVAYADALAACRTTLLASLGSTQSEVLFAPTPASLTLYVPRFELTYETSLKKPLQQLGLLQPFEGGDLTLIATQGGQPVLDLFVDDVIHKVYVKLDEQGTEAAAVTVIVAPTAMPLETEPQIVSFDRPFALVIAEESVPAPLFVGEVHKPEPWVGQ